MATKKELVKKTPAPTPAKKDVKAVVKPAPAQEVKEVAKAATKSIIKKAETPTAPPATPKAAPVKQADKKVVEPPKKVEQQKPATAPAKEPPKAEKQVGEAKGLPRTVAAPEPKFKPIMESKRFKYVLKETVTEEQLKEALVTGEYPIRLFVDEGHEDSRITELVAVYMLDGVAHFIDTTVKGEHRNSHVPIEFKDLNFKSGKLNGLDFAVYYREEKPAE